MDDHELIDNAGAALGQLIGKMAKQGYASGFISSLYPVTIPLVTSESPHAVITRKIWSQTMLKHLMLSPDLTRLITATFQYMAHSISNSEPTNDSIRRLAQGLFALYFAAEQVDSAEAKIVLNLFWKIGWLESHASQSIGATRTLVALLVYAGGVQASQAFDEEGELHYRCS